MTDDTTSDIGHEDGGSTAVAEYVLGLGTAAERAAMSRRIDIDTDIAREAAYWENHFSAFNAAYEPVTPPAAVLGKIESRLFASSAHSTPWYNSLMFWRGATGLALAAAVFGIGLNVLAPQPQPTQPDSGLVTALASVESDVQMVAVYDAAAGQLRMTGSGTPAGAQNDYELWIIVGENDPISMGVVGVEGPQAITVDENLRTQFAQGVTLALTLETVGGSPTGAPQGPIVAAGTTQTI